MGIWGEPSPFQLEGVLDTLYLVQEILVYLQACLHLRAAVYDGRMVTIAYQLANATCRHLGVLLCKIHGHLTGYDKVALAALAANGR